MRHLIYLGTMLALLLTFASVETVQADRLPGSDQGGRPLTAILLGPNEVPPAPSSSQGTAAITINLGQSELCYVIDFTTSETVIAAHIHHAPAGVAAPPVIPLNPPVAGSSSGCKQVDHRDPTEPAGGRIFFWLQAGRSRPPEGHRPESRAVLRKRAHHRASWRCGAGTANEVIRSWSRAAGGVPPSLSEREAQPGAWSTFARDLMVGERYVCRGGDFRHL